MEILYNIFMVVWVISIGIELAVFYSMFHKRHEGETVYYTGSYLNMKAAIAKKDFLDAMAVTIPINIAVIFVVWLMVTYVVTILLHILNFILILTKWGFLIGGFLVLAIGVCTYFSSWDKAKKTESAWDPAYPPLAGMDEALKHQDADKKKDIPEPDELAKRQTALTEALAKKERGETLDDAEKNLLEAYPDGTIPEVKGETTEEERKLLADNPEAQGKAKEYHDARQQVEDSKGFMILAVILIVLGFLASALQNKVATALNPDVAQPETTNTETAHTDDATSYETVEPTPEPTIAPTSTPAPAATPKPTQEPTPEPTETPAGESYDAIPTEIPYKETQWTDYGAETVYGTYYWVGNVLTPEEIGETRAPWCVDAEPALNVRGGPGTEYDKIGSIPYGTWIGQVTSFDMESEWVYVEYTSEDDGQLHYGWVTKEHLTPGY